MVEKWVGKVDRPFRAWGLSRPVLAFIVRRGGVALRESSCPTWCHGRVGGRTLLKSRGAVVKFGSLVGFGKARVPPPHRSPTLLGIPEKLLARLAHLRPEAALVELLLLLLHSQLLQLVLL